MHKHTWKTFQSQFALDSAGELLQLFDLMVALIDSKQTTGETESVELWRDWQGKGADRRTLKKMQQKQLDIGTKQ